MAVAPAIAYRPHRLARKGTRRAVLVWCFLAPSLAIFLLYRIIPLLWNLVLSFADWSPLRTLRWAGLDYLRKDDPLGAQVLQTQLEHTDKFTGNWPLPFDAQLKDAFYPEIQNAVLGRKTAKAALTDAERAVNRVLSRNS